MSGAAGRDPEPWREALDRILDDDPGAVDAVALVAALGDPKARREGARQLRLEADLRALAAEKRGFDAVLSREKLLAKAALREREHVLRRPARPETGGVHTGGAARHGLGRRAAILAGFAAAAAAAYALVTGRLSREIGVTMEGDVRVVRAGKALDDPRPRRGDGFAVGPGGGVVTLGGYARVGLSPGSDASLAGAPRDEAIVLRGGRAEARVVPGHGGFRIETPIGTVQVVGTEFAVAVEPSATAGVPSVQVAVKEGRVACRFGDDTMLLSAGQRQLFGGPPRAGAADGVVVAVDAAGAKVKTDLGTFDILSVGRESAHEIARLQPGDHVTVSWVRKDGALLVTRVFGSLVGRVTAVGDVWLEVTPDRGEPRRFRAPWIGHLPAQGGGPDREVLELIRSQRVGDRIELRWGLLEGQRLLHVTPQR